MLIRDMATGVVYDSSYNFSQLEELIMAMEEGKVQLIEEDELS